MLHVSLARIFAKWCPSVAQAVSPEHVARMLIIQVLGLFKMNRSLFGLVRMHNKYVGNFILPLSEMRTRIVDLLARFAFVTRAKISILSAFS